MEISLALELAAQPRVARALDVGCGNGFSMAALSTMADEVVGFDLPGVSPLTHSVGIKEARYYLARMGIGRTMLMAASAEQIPLTDCSVDLVFAMYVLEHVPDKAKALGEMRRVLRPGGRIILLLPSFLDRLLAPLAHWHYLASRLAVRLRPRKTPQPDDEFTQRATGIPSTRRASLAQELLAKNPSFPLPDPHGAYSSYWEELTGSRTRVWASMFREAGLDATHCFCPYLPPHGLLAIIHPRLPMWLFIKTQEVHRRLGGMEPFRRLGAAYGFVLEPRIS